MATKEEIIKDAKVGRYDAYDKGNVENEGDESDSESEASDNGNYDDQNDFEGENSPAKVGKLAPSPSETALSQTREKSAPPQRLYQHPQCKPILTVGNTSIGVSQARLYGLLDENGEVNFNKRLGKTKSTKVVEKAKEMAKPKEPAVHVVLPEDEDPLEKKRLEDKQKALKAMQNPRLGYDFLSKDRGNFLDRIFVKGDNGKSDKFAEEDYNARLDKLACPSCKKTQTFDEFTENKRMCSLCNQRFTKLNISNLGNFERRIQERNEKKQKKLEAIELEMYGNLKSSSSSSGVEADRRPSSGGVSARTSLTSARSALTGAADDDEQGGLSARSTKSESSVRGGGSKLLSKSATSRASEEEARLPPLYATAPGDMLKSFASQQASAEKFKQLIAPTP